MNLKDLEKGKEIQLGIKICNEKLKQYNRLEAAKEIYICDNDIGTPLNTLYLTGDKKKVVIKAVKDMELIKLNEYIVEFDKL